MTLASLDYDVVAKYDHPRRMRFDGNLDLIKAVVRSFHVRRGADLWVHEKRSLRLQADAINLTDRLNVINFAGLLSGTALAAPRSVAIRLQTEW